MEFSTILSEHENVLGLLYCHQSLKCNTTNINLYKYNSISAILRCWITVFRGRNRFSEAPAHKHVSPFCVSHSDILHSLRSQWSPESITEELCWIMAKTPNLQQLNNRLSSLASNCLANLNNWHWKSCFITRLPPSMFVLRPRVGLSRFRCGSEHLMVLLREPLSCCALPWKLMGVRERWVHTLPISPVQTHLGHKPGERCTVAVPAQTTSALIISKAPALVTWTGRHLFTLTFSLWEKPNQTQHLPQGSKCKGIVGLKNVPQLQKARQLHCHIFQHN